MILLIYVAKLIHKCPCKSHTLLCDVVIGVSTKDQLYKRPTPTKDQLGVVTKDQRLQQTNSTKDIHSKIVML